MNRHDKFVLRNKAHKLRPLLSLDGEFTVEDVKKTNHHMDMNPQNVIFWLYDAGCIEKQERLRNRGGGPLFSWSWNQQQKEYLEEYCERENALPCGCRGHIPDMRESPEGVGKCKHCGTTHSRETFKESL